jgi:hypothetical protein
MATTSVDNFPDLASLKQIVDNTYSSNPLHLFHGDIVIHWNVVIFCVLKYELPSWAQWICQGFTVAFWAMIAATAVLEVTSQWYTILISIPCRKTYSGYVNKVLKNYKMVLVDEI